MCGKLKGNPPVSRTAGFQENVSAVTEPSSFSGRVILDYILAHAKDDERPYLTVSIFGKKILALLDSGASRTILGSDGWKLLQSFCTLNKTKVANCTVANGQICEILGSITIPISLEDKIRIFNILVVPSLPHVLILGCDFWQRMSIVPDLFNGQWTFAKETSFPTVSAIRSAEHLTVTQKQELDELISEVFVKMGNGIGCTDLVEHVIRTESPPIKQRAYPMSPALLKQVDVELKEMLEAGIIEPSKSAWSSPIVLVRKKMAACAFV